MQPTTSVCPSRDVHPPHPLNDRRDCPGLMREATPAEIAVAKSWAKRYTADWDSAAPDFESARQGEYAHALEVLIHANGGRYVRPPACRYAPFNASPLECEDPVVDGLCRAHAPWAAAHIRLDNARAENERLRRRIAVLEASPRAWAPSQGQEIPDDQADALWAEAAGIHGDDRVLTAARQFAIRQAYRVGYAAALGYEITIEDGRVGVGDRPEHAHTYGMACPIAGCRWPLPADLADEAAHERVARAIHAGRFPHNPDLHWTSPALREQNYRIAKAAIDAYRAGQPTVGRCGEAPKPLFVDGMAPITCALPAGHAGWHRSDGGTEWGQPGQPSEHTATGAITDLAVALRARGIALPDLDLPYPNVVVAAARDAIDRLTTALNDAARDAHAELEAVYDGLSTDQEIRARALDAATRLMEGRDLGATAGDGPTVRDVEMTVIGTADRYAEWVATGSYDWQQGTREQRAHVEGYREAVRRLRDAPMAEASRDGFAAYLNGIAPDPDDPWADAMPAAGRPVLDGDTDGSPA